jgi:signal peptidase I
LETRQSSNVQGSLPAERAKSRWRPHLWGWARDLLISIGISAFIIIFLYQPVEVEGTSMLPGLQDQERIFVNKFVYKFEAIQRGDIVVFHYPLDPSKSYIKRVVGVPGDRVRIRDGQVYVNGILLREPYVPAEYFDVRSMVETSVAADSYFVLGDHRSMSNDSRDFGAVDQRYIFGKAVLVYWPVEKLAMVR